MTTIQSITAGPFEITLDLIFSGDMNQDVELSKTSNYIFSNGMYARKIDLLNSNEIRLWVELFNNHDTFSVTISNMVTDIDGYSLSPDTISFSPFKSLASFTNYNGLVRTWHDSSFISADSQRIYLGGEKGIDVFRRISRFNFLKWGQIFDSYGITSMFVYNYPNDVIITDTVSPYLINKSPDEGDIVLSNSSINFSIFDNTAVEIPSVNVYINGLNSFSGNNGGWVDGYYGNIDINYKQLNFSIYPELTLPIGNITVRVTAYDLLGNSLDNSYNFEVISHFLGFGEMSFGFDPFGSV